MTYPSRCLTSKQKARLLDLYARRAELDKAISSLEQLKSLRLRRLREYGGLSLAHIRVA